MNTKDTIELTLRDYFAAKVMQSCLINEKVSDSPDSWIAKWAYEMADEMLKARNT